MKSKGTLILMEQLIMVLVFALAAALCLGIFARVGEMAAQLEERDAAVQLARNAAELLKVTGDPQQVEQQLEGSTFTLEIQEESSETPGLRQVKILVSCADTEIFSLRTGWQEVAP